MSMFNIVLAHVNYFQDVIISKLDFISFDDFKNLQRRCKFAGKHTLRAVVSLGWTLASGVEKPLHAG